MTAELPPNSQSRPVAVYFSDLDALGMVNHAPIRTVGLVTVLHAEGSGSASASTRAPCGPRPGPRRPART